MIFFKDILRPELIKTIRLKKTKLETIKPALSKKYIHIKKTTINKGIFTKDIFWFITLISNLNDLTIRIIDKIINIVVMANGKTAPNGLNVLASWKRINDKITKNIPDINDILSLISLSTFSPIINFFQSR